MKITSLSVIVLSACLVTHCHSPKKTVVTTPPAQPATSQVPASGPGFDTVREPGVFAPGPQELAAIQTQYKEVTEQTLKQGFSIYTGACTNCHTPIGIYQYSETSWTEILNRMAPMARLTDVEKDAVYKYVLAIKATQPK